MPLIGFFPLIVGLIMFLSGLVVLLYRPVLFYVGRVMFRLPTRFFGLLWLLLAVGVALSAYYYLGSVIIYLIAFLMFFDALTLILVPKSFLQTSLVWSVNKNNLYVTFYALFMVTMGVLLLLELLEANYWLFL